MVLPIAELPIVCSFHWPCQENQSLVGLTGYAFAGERTCGNILLNFGDSPLLQAARLSLAFMKRWDLGQDEFLHYRELLFIFITYFCKSCRPHLCLFIFLLKSSRVFLWEENWNVKKKRNRSFWWIIRGSCSDGWRILVCYGDVVMRWRNDELFSIESMKWSNRNGFNKFWGA